MRNLNKEQTENIVEHFLIHNFSILIEVLKELGYGNLSMQLERVREEILLKLEEGK